jgi:hypothetical protein
LRGVNCEQPSRYASAVTTAAPELVRLLAGRKGRFEGSGADSDGADFTAVLIVSEVVGGAAVVLHLTASDAGGQTQYVEHGVLASGEDGAPHYMSVSSSAPFHRDFALRRHGVDDGQAVAVFGWGGLPDAPAGYREEITFVLYADGDTAVAWAYGAPGEPFGPRSAARLSPR